MLVSAIRVGKIFSRGPVPDMVGYAASRKGGSVLVSVLKNKKLPKNSG